MSRTIQLRRGASRTLPRGIAASIAVVTLTSTLGACGHSSAEVAATSPAASAASSETPVATKLSLQSAWINDGEFMGFYTAKDKGYYEQNGVDLTYLPGGPDVLPESQLLTGKADIALTTPDSTAKAIADQGAPFKIIGALFQKSPLGILSLTDGANISKPEDMIGKTIAAGTAATVAVQAMLKANNIPASKVKLVPYSFDPQVILDHKVDGAAEFCPDTPYIIEKKGGKPICTLLDDMGYHMYNDTVVVTADTLAKHRTALVGFLKASRLGWEENFKDPTVYPPTFMNTWFKGTGRTVDQELFYNAHSQPLIDTPNGFFTMDDADIDAVLTQLKAVGINATKDMFDTSLMAEVNTK